MIVNSSAHILKQDAVSLDWFQIGANVQSLRGPIAGIDPAELRDLVATLLQDGALEYICSKGHFDPETHIRHIRPQDVKKWKLPRAIDITGDRIYVRGTGRGTKRVGEGFSKRVCRAVCLNDLTTITIGVIKLKASEFVVDGKTKVDSEEDVRQRVDREIRTQLLLKDVHEVVQIRRTHTYPAKESKGDYHKIALHMEDCDGGDLCDAMLDPMWQPGLEQTLSHFRACLVMLAKLELKHVLHRDHKPENLMLKTEGTRQVLKLGDFGLASTVVDEKGRWTGNKGSASGSREYVCPDLAWTGGALRKSPQDIDRICSTKTDVWSMGVVAYCFLTGGLPSYGDTPHLQGTFKQENLDAGFAQYAVAAQSARHCLRDRPDVFDAMVAVVRKMVVLNLEDRMLGSQLVADFDRRMKALDITVPQ